MYSLFGGYETIHWLQSFHHPLLDGLAVAASSLGTGVFYLLFVPVFYWCISKRDGVRLALVILLSAYVNLALKMLFHMPRPDPDQVRVLFASSASGYAFPSGHAQNAVVFLGWLGRRQPLRRFAWILCLIVFVISLSRIYLGLHFAADVVGGWLIGAVLLVSLVMLDRRISIRPRVWQGLILPWAGVFVPLLLYFLQEQPIQPRISGAIMGFSLGYLLESRWLHFSPQAPLSHQVIKVLGGLGMGGLLWVFLKAGFPPSEGFVFFRYTLFGLWVTLGLPAVYLWLARQREVDACL